MTAEAALTSGGGSADYYCGMKRPAKCKRPDVEVSRPATQMWIQPERPDFICLMVRLGYANVVG